MPTVSTAGSKTFTLDEVINPKDVERIKKRFAQVDGIEEIAVIFNVSGGPHPLVYVFVGYAAAEDCETDMIFPKDAGIKYKKRELNEQRHPRLWLEERAAEIWCHDHVQRDIEFVTFIRNRDGSVTPLDG